MGAPGGFDFLLCAICPKLTNLSPQSHCYRFLVLPCALYTPDSHAADFTVAGVKRVCPVSTQDGGVHPLFPGEDHRVRGAEDDPAVPRIVHPLPGHRLGLGQ